MFFVHDPNSLSYYYGEVEPSPGFARKWLFESSHKMVAVDVETISLKERIAIGVGIAIRIDIAFYFVLFPEPGPNIPWHLLKDINITKAMHNALFDLSAMREYEINTTNITDTNTMAHLLCYKFTKLIDLSFIHKMEIHEASEYIPKGGTTLDVEQVVMAKKCCQDAMATLKLAYEFWDKVDHNYLSVEMQTIPIMVEMSNRGILIDQKMRQQVENELQQQVDYYQSLCKEVGFNPGSPQQVAYILASRGAYSNFTKLPFTRNWRKRSLSTVEEVLEKMDDPLASIVLQYRKHSKLLSTYIKPWVY